jgi:predicted nucleic acid-binding protein
LFLVHEPDGLDAELKYAVGRCATTPNLWTDACLAAFACVAGLQLVSFDRGFSRFARLQYLRLKAN